MITKGKYLLLITIQFVAIHAYNQTNPRLKFFHIGIEQGLSNNTVNCLMQDRTGFLWIGTDNGLDRYDGYRFVLIGGGNDTNTLNSQQVKCLYEDSAGIIWIGTNKGGLHRYDPATGIILHYLNDEKKELIADNNVRKICSDMQGNLWLATENGLTCYDRKSGKFKIYRTIPGDKQSLIFNDVRALCVSKRTGKIWVGTYHGLCLIDPATGKFMRPDTIQQNNLFNKKFINESVSALYEDDKERLWIGEYGAMVQYLDERTNNYYFFPRESNDVIAINSFAQDNAGRLWIGSWVNLVIYDSASNKFFTYQHDNSDPLSLGNNFITAILKDRNGIMWLGTRNGGLNIFYPFRENFNVFSHNDNDPHSLTSNVVECIFKDRDGRLWIGFRQAGLDTGRLETGKFGLFRPFIASTVNRTVGYLEIYRRRHQILNTNGGIQIPGSDRNLPFIERKEWVQSCITDRSGNIWIGTFGQGLFRIDNASHITTCFLYFDEPGNVQSQISYTGVLDILEASDGKIWVATPNGLNSYDPVSTLFTNYKNNKNNPATLSFNEVRKIAEDSNGNIWAGTYGGGICMLNVSTGKFTRYKAPVSNNSSISNIISLCVTKNSVWAGTENGGMIRIDPGTGDVNLVTTGNGLPDNSIAGILEDRNGHLWISTLSGLCEFVPENIIDNSAPGVVFRIFTIADKLPSNEFQKGAYYKDADGRMYFGNTAGLVSFVPEKLEPYPIDAPLVFTDIQLFNHSLAPGDSTKILSQSITQTKELRFKYDQNMITLNFAALGLIDANYIKYSYRLLGFNDQWFTTKEGEHSVTYTSLPPGSYTFEIKAANSSWSDKGEITSLAITVTPPFWQTGWFRALVLAVIALAIYLIYRWRVRIAVSESRKKSEIDRKISELSLTALRSRMNPHFIFNSLSSLQYFIQNMDNKKAETYVNDLSRLIRAMLENSDKPAIPLSDELEMLNKYIELESMRHGNRFDFSINVAEDIDTENIEIPSMLIQPFVENAIVHAFKGLKEKGHIAITMSMEDHLLYCSIEDNGIGRAHAAQLKDQTKHTSIATGDTKNRMDIMSKMLEKNVQLKITDLVNEKQEPAGTRVELYIPVKENF